MKLKLRAIGFCLTGLLCAVSVAGTSFAADVGSNDEIAKWATSHPKFLKRYDANKNGKLDGPEFAEAKPVWEKKQSAKVEKVDKAPAPKGGPVAGAKKKKNK